MRMREARSMKMRERVRARYSLLFGLRCGVSGVVVVVREGDEWRSIGLPE